MIVFVAKLFHYHNLYDPANDDFKCISVIWQIWFLVCPKCVCLATATDRLQATDIKLNGGWLKFIKKEMHRAHNHSSPNEYRQHQYLVGI